MDTANLSSLRPSLRALAAGFLVTLIAAYGVSLLFVFVRTDFKPGGIATQFRGSGPAPAETAPDPGPETDEEAATPLGREWRARSQGLRFPKPLPEMILTTHLHLLGMGMILAITGLIFCFSSFPERFKKPVIIAGFGSLLGDFASMWALRYGGNAFSYAVYAFGLANSACLLLQAGVSLKDLLTPPRQIRA